MIDILFCTNASHQIGMGHLYRSLRLASYLRRHHGLDIRFFSLVYPPTEHILQENQFPVYTFSNPLSANKELARLITELKPAIVINDLLNTEYEMLQIQKKQGAKICNFDDTGAGVDEADLLLNPIAFHWPSMKGKVPKGQYYYGPEFMVLDERFEQYRQEREIWNPRCQQILVTMGGTDTWNTSQKVVRSMIPLAQEGGVRMTVTIGPGVQREGEFCHWMEALSLPSIRYEKGRHWLGELMAEADLLVCSGGVTLYEGAYLGKPMLSIAAEPHEIDNINYFAGRGTTRYIGFRNEWEDTELLGQVRKLRRDEQLLRQMHEAGIALVDGCGLKRVSQLLLALL